MKGFIYFTVPALLAACVSCGGQLSPVRPVKENNIRPLVPSDSIPVSDSALLLAAVRFDKSYDWRRDSLHGSVDFELVVFADDRELLCIPAGKDAPFSPDPLTHHLIGGNLYTEYTDDASGTVICCNGEEIMRFPFAEKLLGLLPHDGDIYTLSQYKGGEGFIYRKNGEIVLMRGAGRIFGNFGAPSYGTSGALYLDGAKPTFCYEEVKGKAYAVRGGKEIPSRLKYEKGSDMLDMKLMDGTLTYAFASYAKLDALEATLWGEHPQEYIVCFIPDDDGEPRSALARAGSLWIHETIAPLPGRIYYSPERIFVIGEDKDGCPLFYSSLTGSVMELGRYCLACETSVFFDQRGWIEAALTALDGSDKHLIVRPGFKEKSFELHGYPTAVERLSPPS